jgi:hypothetical protein
LEALIAPPDACPQDFVAECRVGVPQVDEIDILGDRALLDIGRKLGKETSGKIITRQDRDIDVAMLALIPPSARTEQPHRRVMLAEGTQHHAAQCLDRLFANPVHVQLGAVGSAFAQEITTEARG